jgi:hypothetical protein
MDGWMGGLGSRSRGSSRIRKWNEQSVLIVFNMCGEVLYCIVQYSSALFVRRISSNRPALSEFCRQPSHHVYTCPLFLFSIVQDEHTLRIVKLFVMFQRQSVHMRFLLIDDPTYGTVGTVINTQTMKQSDFQISCTNSPKRQFLR